MDEELARQLATMIAPFTPYIIKGVKIAGKEMVGAAGKAVGKKIPDAIKSLWGRLSPEIENRPEAIEAVTSVAANPEDPAALSNLQQQLAALLEDPSFRSEIAELISQAREDKTVLSIVQEYEQVHGSLIGLSVAKGSDIKESGLSEIRIKQTGKEISESGSVIGPVLGGKRKK